MEDCAVWKETYLAESRKTVQDVNRVRMFLRAYEECLRKSI